MIIKIAVSGTPQYVLIDNVTDLVYTSSATHIYSSDELRDLIAHYELLSDHKLLINDERVADFCSLPQVAHENRHPVQTPWYSIHEIFYTQGGKEFKYLFDSFAYICNDKGETLEKCHEQIYDKSVDEPTSVGI